MSEITKTGDKFNVKTGVIMLIVFLIITLIIALIALIRSGSSSEGAYDAKGDDMSDVGTLTAKRGVVGKLVSDGVQSNSIVTEKAEVGTLTIGLEGLLGNSPYTFPTAKGTANQVLTVPTTGTQLTFAATPSSIPPPSENVNNGVAVFGNDPTNLGTPSAVTLSSGGDLANVNSIAVETLTVANTVTDDLTTNGDVQFNVGSLQIMGSTVQINPVGSCEIAPTGLLSLSSFSTTGNITMGGTAKISDLANATDQTDAVNLQTADARYLKLSGGKMTGNINMDYTELDNLKQLQIIANQPDRGKITIFNANQGTATYKSIIRSDSTTNKGLCDIEHLYNFSGNIESVLSLKVDRQDADFPSLFVVELDTIQEFVIRATGIDAVSKNIINVTDPTDPHHASTKNYVDMKTWETIIQPASTPPSNITGSGITYVNSGSNNLVYKYNNIEYPIAGPEGKVVKKFNPTSITTLYEDTYIKIMYNTLQPLYQLKTLPTGNNLTAVSIEFIQNDIIIAGNGLGTAQTLTDLYFYGGTSTQTPFDNTIIGSTSRCLLVADEDIAYPTYSLVLIISKSTGCGVSVVERY